MGHVEEELGRMKRVGRVVLEEGSEWEIRQKIRDEEKLEKPA